MAEFPIELGQRASFSKTVSESDVYQFAGITGDFAPNHVNQAYMEKTRYGKLMVHGALLVGFMSTASSMVAAQTREGPDTAVSLGYDRIRFVGPVYFGDTITVSYEIVEIDVDRKRSTASIEITNQDGETVAVARHIIKLVANQP